MKKYFLIVGFLLVQIFFSHRVFGQNVTDPGDDFDAPIDTAAFYKKMYSYSKNKKMLYLIYRSVFNPPAKPVVAARAKSKNKVAAVGMTPEKYKGKIIRRVNIISFEPFGTSLSDTSRKPHSTIQKGGNKVHALTNNATIRNRILFSRNQPADPLKISESERLLRSTGYIRDARIFVKAVKGSSDSVDVEIWTQDYWSIRPDITASTNKVRYRLTDNNILGFGHKVDFRLTDKIKDSTPLVLDASYQIPSLYNTYISPELYYGNSAENNVRGLRVNRPFYSPLTRLAGGLDILSIAKTDSTQIQGDTVYYPFSYKTFETDVWVGASWKLLHGNTDEERSTKIVTALRYARIRYPVLNTSDVVSENYFASADLYLGSLSLTARKYVKDRYIFKFGETEDVPDGRKLTFTTGYEKSSFTERYYVGIDGAIGTYFSSLGYFYLSTGYGSYFKETTFTQGLISAALIYVTPLKKIWNWRYRQFSTFNFDFGIDRKYSEKIYLNGENGIPGYKSDYPQGTSRASFSTQIILYTPYEFIGFRFAPILLAGAGMVGDYNRSPFHGRVYQSYGIGVLIKNDFLVLNTFQITIAWYPVLPVPGSAIRFNPVKLNQARFPDFEITRPSVAAFQ